MNLYINRNLDASSSSVVGQNENTNQSIQSLYLGDVQEINIYLVDGNGNFDAQSGSAVLTLGIGDLDTGEVYAQTSNFVFDSVTNAYSGTLVLSTYALANVLSNLDSASFTLEVQMEFASNSITILQQSVTVFNQLITSVNEGVDGSYTNTDMLYLHYKCNELTTDGKGKDDSGNERHLDMYGATITEGRFGNAYHFDGVQDFANAFANYSSLGNIYTVAFYVMLQNADSEKRLPILTFAKGEINENKYVEVYQENSKIKIESNYGANKNFIVSQNAESNTWYHIAVVKTSDTTQEVYVNGSLKHLAYKSYWGNQQANRLELGKDQYAPRFEGKIDDVRIYDRALNGAEMMTLYEPNPIWIDYIVDTESDLENGDILRIKEEFVANNGVRFSEGEVATNIKEDVTTNIHLLKTSGQTAYVDVSQRGTVYEKIIEPPVVNTDTSSDSDTDTDTDNSNGSNTDTDDSNNSNGSDDTNTETPTTAYYVYGDDGTANGEGYYFPVYLEDTGLGANHTHTIGGITYYMEDANTNHGLASLPSDNTLPIAPNTSVPNPNIVSIVGYSGGDWQFTTTSTNVTLYSQPNGYGYYYGNNNPNLAIHQNAEIEFINNSSSDFYVWRMGSGGQGVLLFSVMAGATHTETFNTLNEYNGSSTDGYFYSIDSDINSGSIGTQGHIYVG